MKANKVEGFLKDKKSLQNHHLDVSYGVTFKSTLDISQNVSAFLEYMNFNLEDHYQQKPKSPLWTSHPKFFKECLLSSMSCFRIFTFSGIF